MTASIYALARAILTIMDGIAAKTANFNGGAFDTLDYEGDILVEQFVGVVSGTTPTLDGRIEESDTSGGTYTAISGATFTQVTATNNLQAKSLRIGDQKRFIRYAATIAGTTPSFTMGTAFIGRRKYES